MAEKENSNDQDRRNFFAKASAALGGLLALFPFAAGFGFLLHPLRHKKARDQWIKIVPLSAVPEDGTPGRFPVVRAESIDAWTKQTDVPVGAVYLRRLNGGGVKAFNVSCPHLGCAIDFRAADRDFYCPCHNSFFAMDGAVSNPDSPSPRGMDTLQTKVEDGEVMVRYVEYQAGKKDKIPVT